MWHIVHFQKECQVVCPVIYAVRCRDICTSLLLPLPIRVGRLWGSSLLCVQDIRLIIMLIISPAYLKLLIVIISILLAIGILWDMLRK